MSYQNAFARVVRPANTPTGQLPVSPRWNRFASRPLIPSELIVSLMAEAYCVKEKAKREMSSPREVTLKNGRRALQGTCSSCGTKLFKILGK